MLVWGECGGNGGTGKKSMLGRVRGFNDNKESIVGKLRVTRERRSREKKEFFYVTHVSCKI